MDAGSYFVSATARPWYVLRPVSAHQPGTANLPTAIDQSLDAAYPITYYGDSTEPDDATPIPVRGGDHLEADIHLNPVPALHLLIRAPENQIDGFHMPTLEKPSFEGVEPVQPESIQMVSPGVFEIDGIAPGRYSIRDNGTGQGDEDSQIDITTNNQELDTSKAQRASTIKATIQVLGEATLPPQIEIALRNRKLRIVAWRRDG